MTLRSALPIAQARFVGVIGDPVVHSLSPAIHNAAYNALGIPWIYGAFSVDAKDVSASLHGARALGFRGLSVTMPHKQAAARIAEQLTPRCERLGAANTITYEAGVIVGESTDGEGFIEDLRENAQFDPSEKRCAVLGAGGAARAVILALVEHGARQVLVINRTPERAQAAVELGPGVVCEASLAEAREADLIVNATPLGMDSNQADPLMTGLEAVFGTGQLAVDLIYSPAQTPFMAMAEAKGAQTRNGLGTLIGQAARQIELWTDVVAPRAVMWSAAKGALDHPERL